MTERIIIAGSGGQGIILLGKVLAEAAMRGNKHVTWMPSYGAEVRGGTAYCMVIISDEEIGTPCIDKADTLIVMNEPSYERFQFRVKKNGLLIVNTSLGLRELKNTSHRAGYPFTDIAVGLGNIKVANMVALGCFLAKKKIFDQEFVLNTIKEIAPPGKKYLVAINKEAVLRGVGLILKKPDKLFAANNERKAIL